MPRMPLLPFLTAALTACAADAPADRTILDGEARSADGVAIRYDARGSGDPALVLVHGWTNTREIWGEHPVTLAREHRVVTLDLAGHGATGENRATWTMDAFGEDVAAVVEELGLERVVLVGFSMGGPVVLEAADRLGERVAGIIFIDTMHDPDRVMPEAQFEQMMAAVRTNWRDTAFVRAFAYTPDTPDSLVRQTTERMPPEPRQHWFAVARAMRSWMETEMASALHAVDVPVAGINTTRQPTNVEALRRYLRSFTLDTLAGVGHAGILHQRVEDFDARLLAIVDRFVATSDSGGVSGSR